MRKAPVIYAGDISGWLKFIGHDMTLSRVREVVGTLSQGYIHLWLIIFVCTLPVREWLYTFN